MVGVVRDHVGRYGKGSMMPGYSECLNISHSAKLYEDREDDIL